MDNKHKTTLFSVLAATMAASSAPAAADKSINHALIVLPLVLMGIFLFLAGYYAGRSRNGERGG